MKDDWFNELQQEIMETNTMTTPTQLTAKELLAEAQRLGGHKTKRETINEALTEYFIDFDPEFLAELDRQSQPR
jgi:Arc/MetJ family transcription regulator